MIPLKKIGMLVALSPVFLAVICEGEDEAPILIANEMKVTLPLQTTFSVGDTLWLQGRVSWKVFEKKSLDSIKDSNDSVGEVIYVLQLKPANRDSNTEEALQAFTSIATFGSTDVVDICPTAKLVTIATLTENGSMFQYKIGLVAQNPGVYVLSCDLPKDFGIQNLNARLLENYPLNGSTKELGLNQCNQLSTITDVTERKSDFFFSVN